MPTEEQKTETEALTEELKKLNAALKKTNSLWGGLGRSIFSGVGTVVGATIIATIALTLAWHLVQYFHWENALRAFGIKVPDTEQHAQ